MEATEIELYKGVKNNEVVYITAIHSDSSVVIVNIVEEYEDALLMTKDLASMLYLSITNKVK